MFVLRFLFREKPIAESVLPNVMALACKCCDIVAAFIWVIGTCSLVCMMDVWEKKHSLRLQGRWMKGRR